MRKLVLAAAVGVAGIGVFAAIGLGDEGSSRPAALDRDFDRIAVHRTDTPSASASATAQASKNGKPKVKYFETSAFPVPAAGTDVSTACPKKFKKALAGYYLTSGGIVPDLFAISESSTRVWLFGLANLTGGPGTAVVGLVCGKKL